MPPVAGPVRHGTNHMYAEYGCRCGHCRHAMSTYRRRLREAKAAREGRVSVPRGVRGVCRNDRRVTKSEGWIQNP